jgi:hypothetical protein
VPPATLKISRTLALPLDLVTEATAIVATRGAGKSSASAVIVEESFPIGVQSVIFDRTGVYWGLRSNRKGDGPGLPIYVLGGPHGDVPLEPHAGVLIADLAVDSGHSFVLDLSDMSKSGAVRFAADFLERLYDRKARARTTTLLIMDEAHFYAPQTPRGGFKGDSARLMGAMEDVVGLGRSRGLGVVLTTQRTQSLNKAVLDLIETLIVMRMLSPRARDAVRGWIMEKHEDDDRGVIATLDSLPDGTAWVWSPLRGILENVALRRIRTFDSFAKPKPGETLVEPTARKELDLAALGEQMAATVERAKANDPDELRRQIRDLQRQLAERPEAEPAEPVEVSVEVPVFPAPLRDAIRADYEGLRGQGQALIESAEYRLKMLDADYDLAIDIARDVPSRPEVPQPPARKPPPPPRRPAVPNVAGADPGVALNRRAERAVLAVLAQHSPESRTVRQVAIQAGYAKGGGGFRGALSKLRTHGLIVGQGDLRITEAGLAAIDGQWEPLPQGRALLDYWLGQMNRAAERAVLQAVYDAHSSNGGGWIDVAEVAAQTGYEAAGGGFRGALSKLRTLGLIEGTGTVRASDDLFA